MFELGRKVRAVQRLKNIEEGYTHTDNPALVYPIAKATGGQDDGQAFIIDGLLCWVPNTKPVVHVRHGTMSLLKRLDRHFEFFICTRASSFEYVSVLRRILDGTKAQEFTFLKNDPCLAFKSGRRDGIKRIESTMQVAEKLYSTTLAVVLDDNERGRHYCEGEATWESKATAQIVACTYFDRYGGDDEKQGLRGLDGYCDTLKEVAERFYRGIDSICSTYKKGIFCDESVACPTCRPETSNADVAMMLEKVIRGPTLSNTGVSPPNSPRR